MGVRAGRANPATWRSAPSGASAHTPLPSPGRVRQERVRLPSKTSLSAISSVPSGACASAEGVRKPVNCTGTGASGAGRSALVASVVTLPVARSSWRMR